jgi:hypothetical protein
MKAEIRNYDDDSRGIVMTVGAHHAAMRVSVRALKLASERGPNAMFDLLANEFCGLIGAIEARQQNRPTVGSKVRIKGQRGMWTVIAIKQCGLPDAGITARRPVEPEDDLTDDALECTVPWTDCEYV